MLQGSLSIELIQELGDKMTKIGKRATKELFNTLFHGYNFKRGDFVKFKSGKIYYSINEIDNSSIILLSLPKQRERTQIRGFEIKNVASRLRKVSQRTIFYFLCLNKPDELSRFFSEKTRMKLFRKYLKPIKRRM